MCFSATASVVTGTVLLGGGIASLTQVRKRSQVPFAAIPLIFSIQQFTEAFVWMSLTGHTADKSTAIYVFLFFAQVVWPIYVPLSMLSIEDQPKRKRFLSVLLAIGAMTGLYLGYALLHFPSHASVHAHHIRYDLDIPHYQSLVCGACYVLVTVLPPFISSVRRVPLLGVVLLSLFLISYFFFDEYLISVWCFFAAVISIVVLFIMRALRKIWDGGKGGIVAHN